MGKSWQEKVDCMFVVQLFLSWCFGLWFLNPLMVEADREGCCAELNSKQMPNSCSSSSTSALLLFPHGATHSARERGDSDLPSRTQQEQTEQGPTFGSSHYRRKTGNINEKTYVPWVITGRKWPGVLRTPLGKKVGLGPERLKGGSHLEGDLGKIAPEESTHGKGTPSASSLNLSTHICARQRVTASTSS